MTGILEAQGGGFGLPRGEFRAVPLRGIALARAYRATLAIYLSGLLVSLRFDSLKVSLGLTAGTALATAVLASWQFVVSRAFGPGRQGGKGWAVALGLVKFPVVCGILYLLISRGLVSPEAFAVGFLFPLLAIALLAVGGRMGNLSSEATHAAPRA
ncbi:MAG TPA: hypothetical protein VHF22_15030 [Planctomycetota bacterium]|nr:hypothetical protein [Planctomycetota bacterium]